MWISGSLLGVLAELSVDLPALGVVERHRADQRELQLGNLLTHELVGGDHAEGVLPGIEARDLRDQPPGQVDTDPVEDLAGRVIRDVEVLRAERVDRRRDRADAGDRQIGRDELRHGEHGSVVVAEEGAQKSPGVGVGL